MQARNYPNDRMCKHTHILLGQLLAPLSPVVEIIQQAVLCKLCDHIQKPIVRVHCWIAVSIPREVNKLHEQGVDLDFFKLVAPQAGVEWHLQWFQQVKQHLDLSLVLQHRDRLPIFLHVLREEALLLDEIWRGFVDLDGKRLAGLVVDATPADAGATLAHDVLVAHEHGVLPHYQPTCVRTLFIRHGHLEVLVTYGELFLLGPIWGLVGDGDNLVLHIDDLSAYPPRPRDGPHLDPIPNLVSLGLGCGRQCFGLLARNFERLGYHHLLRLGGLFQDATRSFG
mmetsp:Transcript_40763/g.107804  ORF Transcript_40763/g.107804 Transcript_40763/m.107804 type:complete len:282 (+) Transcript_40763:380-1225(+)